MTIDQTITQRNSTHGDFAENARISQGLKSWICTSENWKNLTYIQREALDLICTKISRVLSGGSNHTDNWHDIAGYARLAELETLGKIVPNTQNGDWDYDRKFETMIQAEAENELPA